MILGFVIDSATATAIAAGVEHAQTSRGLVPYIAAQTVEIHGGEHVGKQFLPLSDADLNQIMRGGLRLTDFPEFAQLVGMLGGLDARVEIDPADLIDPKDQL